MQAQNALLLSNITPTQRQLVLTSIGSAVGSGCFSDNIPQATVTGNATYLEQPAHIVEPRKIGWVSKGNKRLSPSKVKAGSKGFGKSASCGVPTFRSLQIDVHDRTELNEIDMAEKHAQNSPNVTVQKQKLNEAKYHLNDMEKFLDTSCTLKPTLSNGEFADALRLATKAEESFKLANDNSRALQVKAFEYRAVGDREMNGFVNCLISQEYDFAEAYFQRAIVQYGKLYKIKSSTKYVQETSMHQEVQDTERFRLITVDAKTIVHSFATTAAFNAIKKALYVTKHARSMMHIERSLELFAIAERAYEWLDEPPTHLDLLKEKIEAAGFTLDKKKKANEALAKHRKAKVRDSAVEHAQNVKFEVDRVRELSRKADILCSYRQSLVVREIEKRKMINVRADASVKEALNRGHEVVRSRATTRTARKQRKQKCKTHELTQHESQAQDTLASKIASATTEDVDFEELDYLRARQVRINLLFTLKEDCQRAGKAPPFDENALDISTLQDLSIQAHIEAVRDLMGAKPDAMPIKDAQNLVETIFVSSQHR